MLDQKTVRRMIENFIILKKVPKKELANMLGVKLKTIDNLRVDGTNRNYRPELQLRLIKLYCKTKWS